MRKTIIFAMVFSVFFLCINISFGEEFPNSEKRIYYDTLEMFYQLPPGASYKPVYQKIAKKFKISEQKVKDIYDKWFDRPLTDLEKKIGEEVWNKMPKDADPNVYHPKIYKQIAEKYKLTPIEVHSIYDRWDMEMLLDSLGFDF